MQSDNIRYSDENRSRIEKMKDQISENTEKHTMLSNDLLKQERLTRNVSIVFGVVIIVLAALGLIL